VALNAEGSIVNQNFSGYDLFIGRNFRVIVMSRLSAGQERARERDRFGSTARLRASADRERTTHRVDVYSGRSFGIEVSLLLEQSTVAPLHVHGAGQAPGRMHSPALFVSNSSSPADKVPE